MRFVFNIKEIKIMRDEMIKLGKVKKSCRISGILSKILACIVTVGFVGAVAGMIILGVIGHDKINSEISKSIESGDSTFNVDDVKIDGMFQVSVKLNEMVEQGQYAEVITIVCAFVAIVTAAVSIIFWMLVGIFKEIGKSNTPFTVSVLKRVKAIFIMAVVIAVFSSGLGMGVIAGCIGWSLYSIFDYGFVIQQEIDETL